MPDSLNTEIGTRIVPCSTLVANHGTDAHDDSTPTTNPVPAVKQSAHDC